LSHAPAVHFALCLFTYNCSSHLREHKQKLQIAYLTSWHNSNFGCKLKARCTAFQCRLQWITGFFWTLEKNWRRSVL